MKKTNEEVFFEENLYSSSFALPGALRRTAHRLYARVAAAGAHDLFLCGGGTGRRP